MCTNQWQVLLMVTRCLFNMKKWFCLFRLPNRLLHNSVLISDDITTTLLPLIISQLSMLNPDTEQITLKFSGTLSSLIWTYRRGLRVRCALNAV